MTKDQDWKINEKIVAILERQIGPHASVKRDVNLPVINSKSGRTRQCDVVVEEGSEPRKTITIVEVQKRKSKPAINDFNGWVEKLREVGAQHLICVSEAGFPKSIQEKAENIGPTIRLVTLKRMQDPNWPFPKHTFEHNLQVVRYDKLLGMQFEGEHVFRVDPNNPNPTALPNPHERCFKLPDGREISPTDVVDWHLFSNPDNFNSLPSNIPFTLGVKFDWGYNEGLRYKDFGGTWVFLKNLLIKINIFISQKNIEWEAQSYEQINWGNMAWALRGKAQLDDGSFDMIAPIVKIAPGEYKIRTPVVLGNHDAFVAIGSKGYRAERYVD